MAARAQSAAGKKERVHAPAADGQPEAAPQSEAAEKQLAQLAGALREDRTTAYARLTAYANKYAANELGARAALALGYYDFTKGRQMQAQRWLERAARQAERAGHDSLLREYVLYWLTQVNRAMGHQAEALAQLEEFRQQFPESVMTEQAVQSLAETSLALGRADRALAALEAYDKAASKPPLLLLRAQAREQAGQASAAADDYRAVYYRFPLSDEADIAGKRLSGLARSLGEELPSIAPEQQIALQAGRAAAFFDVRRWSEARSEYEKLMPLLEKTPNGVERERTELRIAYSRGMLGSAPSALESLALTDPELDAERLYRLSQLRRSQDQESEMLALIEQLASRHPQSPWSEEGLYAAGNYFWVNLDRQRAAAYYQRVLERFPSGKYAYSAHWRLAWLAYLERRPEAAELFEEHLRRFPGSSYAADAVYWLGRAAEHAENVAHARSFYLKCQERFPQSYFGERAADRLRALGPEPVNSAEFLALIPAPPPLPSLDEAIPPAANERWARAQALRTIAFDASAELELRAAYATTGSARLLLEAAQFAIQAGHYASGIATVRQLYPQLEARKLEEVPLPVWRAVYPLPYESSLRRAATRQRVAPMLVAGLIRQESTFQPDAVSRAGAVGLMQVLPKTGRKLAPRLKLRYARTRLFDPEYNLRLGTLYLADLVKAFGSLEAALAAYNAGEDRVTSWEAERRFEEPAEFAESIPFTETREYVQIVLRNAEIYRRLYEKPLWSAP